MAGLLSRERIVAGPGFNRWLVPPAALAIHLSIGMAYGFSVFLLALRCAVGIRCAAGGACEGEPEGPRKAGFVAACCWGGGFFIAAIGIYFHQIALLWLGSGGLGGCGLG